METVFIILGGVFVIGAIVFAVDVYKKTFKKDAPKQRPPVPNAGNPWDSLMDTLTGIFSMVEDDEGREKVLNKFKDEIAKYKGNPEFNRELKALLDS